MQDPVEILKKYWGFSSFRPLQQEVIQSVLSANDSLALMPTGGGKSICFQVPSLAMDGICLVISPLIALMKDQVHNLKKKGIPALSIYTGMSFIEVKKTLQNAVYGNFKFLYISPERLQTDLFKEFLPALKLNLIAVDESHCISQWGYDFRPAYLHIAEIRELFPDVPVLALTASATGAVQKDICEKLQFRKGYEVFKQPFERPNLSYSAFHLSSKQQKLLQILQKVPGSGIVYCKTRKRTKEIAEILQLNGISANFYHAGLSNEERTIRQQNWINNQTRIICCTNAFGMGIDKPDVRTVIHFDVPEALENYYQEAGRAGRDEKKAYAVLLYNSKEISTIKEQSAIKFPSMEMIRKTYAALCNYFQLAAGCGEQVSFDFDMNTFVQRFGLDTFTVNNVIKILEQEELLNLSEQLLKPSTVEFCVSKNDLEIFEQTEPSFDPVIKGLLRFYQGIFDFPVTINEDRLAKFISVKKDFLIESLNELNRLGIIEYVGQKENPQILFLQNRVHAKDLIINEKNLATRKHAYEKRLAAMVNYVLDSKSCRSQMIANYFNDSTTKPCGICDHCLEKAKLPPTLEEIQQISKYIKAICKKEPVSLPALLNQMPAFSKHKIKKIVSFLQEENQLSVTIDGLLMVV
jgi:ATP-dependent DNA helicase RecQ